MITDTFRIYRKLNATRENNQPWMKLREEYAWLQQEAKYPPASQASSTQKPPSFNKR